LKIFAFNQSCQTAKGSLAHATQRRIGVSMKMLLAGKFNNVPLLRPFHGRGSLVAVREGSFVSRHVRLEIDVTPQMRGGLKVPISIDGVKAVIELHKLAL
jgi:hypothetical protein